LGDASEKSTGKRIFLKVTMVFFSLCRPKNG
jgi:hypothetical protein